MSRQSRRREAPNFLDTPTGLAAGLGVEVSPSETDRGDQPRERASDSPQKFGSPVSPPHTGGWANSAMLMQLHLQGIILLAAGVA